MYVCILSGACWHGNISTLLAFCDPSPVLNLCEGKRSVTAGNPSTHWQALMFTLIYAWTNGWTKMELLVIWNLMTFIWRHYNAYLLQTSKYNFVLQHLSVVCGIHSVESPSMVDPQWNIWYRGSKWNLHTVCWSAVGCEWGTTSVYFGITYVCFIPSRLPVFAVEPQYLLQYFLFLSKVSFELHIQNLQKISCWFKIWMGFVGPILIKLWTSSIWGFL